MVRMFKMVDNIYFEGVFVRSDGELEPIFDNVLILRGSTTERLVKSINESVNVDGKIQIYKIMGNNNFSQLYKTIEVYNELDIKSCN